MANQMTDPRVAASPRNIAELDGRRALDELQLEGPQFRALFTAHCRVIGAVILRDIRTRVAGTRFGFLLSLMMPLGHIGILLTVYYIVGRSAPIGTDTTIFLGTGTLAFVTWAYTFRHIKMAPQQNRALTQLPGVTMIDLILARAIVELISATLVAAFTLSALRLLGLDLRIFNAPLFAFILFQCYLLGVSFGFFFAVLGRIWPGILMLSNLMLPLFWISSGVLFIPSMLPEQLSRWVWYLPLSQLVDRTRVAYYGYYISNFYSEAYIAGVMLAVVGMAAILLQVMRTAVTEA